MTMPPTTLSTSQRRPGPAATADVIIELSAGGIVLVSRKYQPFGWALPGGFVDAGETLAQAARREAKEETSLDVEITELFHCYSDPRRDQRLHTVSAVFIARADGIPVASDDAAGVDVFAADNLPSPLAFDHQTILEDFFLYRKTGRRPSPER
ncbi:MAG: NUDIX hydrolase [Pseudomonadota bacterium]